MRARKAPLARKAAERERDVRAVINGHLREQLRSQRCVAAQHCSDFGFQGVPLLVRCDRTDCCQYVGCNDVAVKGEGGPHLFQNSQRVLISQALAGAAAAAYVQNGEIETETALPLAAGEGIGYTVPQHIRLDGVQKSVSVSFRVRRNYGPSTITVRCGPNKIAAFKRERLAPGEMEHITLPKALLQKADGPLIVAVEEVPQS